MLGASEIRIPVLNVRVVTIFPRIMYTIAINLMSRLGESKKGGTRNTESSFTFLCTIIRLKKCWLPVALFHVNGIFEGLDYVLYLLVFRLFPQVAHTI